MYSICCACPARIARRYEATSRRPASWTGTTSSSRPSELDLSQGIPTTPADVAALRNVRATRRLSAEQYLKALARLQAPSLEAFGPGSAPTGASPSGCPEDARSGPRRLQRGGQAEARGAAHAQAEMNALTTLLRRDQPDVYPRTAGSPSGWRPCWSRSWARSDLAPELSRDTVRRRARVAEYDFPSELPAGRPFPGEGGVGTV